MASLSHHARSNSLPSTPNVFVSQVDERLGRLSSSESASYSTSSISSKLTHLSDLYECIDEFLQLPSSRKALSCQEKLIEDSLEGSIKLLDICSNISDVMVQMKERVQELQSILRRRCSDDEIAMEVAKYLRSRKMAIKVFSKELKNLKKIDNIFDMEMNENEVTRRLKESQMATLNVLESVLAAIVGPKAQRSNWESVVSKLLRSKSVTSQQETTFFLVGFEAMDVALHPKKAMGGLEKMEINIKDVEQGLECLFRHLIKTRTTILNC